MKGSLNFKVFATGCLEMKILRLFGLIIAITLSTVDGSNDTECEMTLCQVFSEMKQELFYNETFESYLDDDLPSGHSALRKVLAELGEEMNIDDSMPLQTYVVKYQKILQDETLATLNATVSDESANLSGIIDDLEKTLMRTLDEQYVNITEHIDLVSEKMEDKLLQRIDRMEMWLKETVKEMKRMTKMPSSSSELPLTMEEICPQGWTRNEMKPYCYYFGTEDQKMNYTDAKTYCQGFGGSLVSIKTIQENMFILSKLTHRSWIGLDDLKKQGRYVWNDGAALTFKYWGKAEPNGDHERCVEVKKYKDDFLWNDVPCGDSTNAPICKRTTIFQQLGPTQVAMFHKMVQPIAGKAFF